MQYELDPELKRQVTEAFEDVLDSGVPPYEVGQLHLFNEEDESFIQREVKRKLHEPELPNGGNRERKIIERLRKLAMNREFGGHGRASYAIIQWEKVLPDCLCHGNGCPKCWNSAGRYYTRKPLRPKESKADWEWYTSLRDSAHSSRLWEQKWFAQLMLDGLPEPCSDFAIECKFILRDDAGQVLRLVKVKNVAGKESEGKHPGGCMELDAASFQAPEKFRGWCIHNGNFKWSGGSTELHKLYEDMFRDTDYKIVNKIESVGWYPLGGKRDGSLMQGIWFADECAFVDGKVVRPDDDGIIWHNGEGYYLCAQGREMVFIQGRPKMQPDLKFEDCKFDTSDWDKKPEDIGDLAAFFREACKRFYETLASFEGYFLLGAQLAYAAGPELFADHRFRSGLFIHGQRGSGKSSGVGWSMNVYGYNLTSGIALTKKSSTAVGILGQAENYSCQPVWLDEFRTYEIEEDKAGILRSAYDGGLQVKWSPDGKVRAMKTSFIVSGESTSSDNATRNRYPHVQFSADKRQVAHEAWFVKNAPFFVLFGRYVLEHRREYVEKFQLYFKSWLAKGKLEAIDDRERKVHGVVYAGWMSMVALLGSHGPKEVKAFEEFMVTHCSSAAADVGAETNVMVFLTDMLTAFKAGAIPASCFRAESERLAHPPDAPNQTSGWKHWKLYIDPNQVIAHLQIWLTKQRGSVTLRRNDLRNQMSKMPGWIDGEIRMRLGQDGERGPAIACWGIDLDKHSMGYQLCSDEEHEKFLIPRQPTDPEPVDPREGPLFAIIYGIQKKEREEAQAKA